MSEQKDKCPDCYKGLQFLDIEKYPSTPAIRCPTCNGTGEKKLNSPDREKIAGIVDDALTSEALIVLNLDREKIKAIKDWTDNQINANYKLRETTIDKIIALIKPLIEEVKTRMKAEFTDLVDQMLRLHKKEIEEARREVFKLAQNSLGTEIRDLGEFKECLDELRGYRETDLIEAKKQEKKDIYSLLCPKCQGILDGAVKAE